MLDQIGNPRHCFIQMAPGRFLCHTEDNFGSLSFKKGDKIRFTRIAAERFLKSGDKGMQLAFQNAVLVNA